MKCPICEQELKNISLIWFCNNKNCRAYNWTMEEVAWQELIRTRKALKIAVDALEEYEDADSYDCDGNWCGWKYSTAHDALKQITALEQNKKVFAHNKIKFPEFNDNLLEEFDKQFFENGQDDDLTETALGQKE